MRRPSLTRRERETLQAVARRLTNAEIAEEFGVSVRTVESHIAALRRKLLAESRRELVQAAESYVGRPVPAPLDSFVGREHALAQTLELLLAERWVTLTGPAGVGKSRLALELAHRSPSVVVELESAGSGDVLVAIASALGMEAVASPALLATCAVALSAGPLQLVLDNADRVAAEVVPVVRQLLGRAQQLRVIVTTRTPLRGPGEIVVDLDPLPANSPADAGVRLFLDRARAASRTTDLSDQALAVDVCRRLEGVPLAIELAAARTRHLSLAELDRRLAEGFETLGTSVDRTQRNTALAAAFAWSWDLLDLGLREVLMHLAALPHVFDLDLASAAVGRRVDGEVVELLDRSLLTRAGDPAARARFRIVAALREFVLGRTGPQVREVVAGRHACHFREIARNVAGRARFDDRPETRELAHLAFPEIAEALRWAVLAGDAMAAELAVAVGIGIEQYGPEQGMMRALVEAVADERVRIRWTAPDLAVVGQALTYAHLDLVDELAARARELAGAGDQVDLLAADQLTGYVLVHRERPAEALPVLDEALRRATELRDHWWRAVVLQTRAKCLHRVGDRDTEEVLAAFEAARSAYAAAGDAMHVNNVRSLMAQVAAEDPRRRDQAAAWAVECLTYATCHGNEVEMGHARLSRAKAVPIGSHEDLTEAVRLFRRAGDLRCLSRGLVALAEHEPEEAEPLLREALDVSAASGDLQLHVIATAALGTLLWEQSRHAEANALLGAAAEELPPAALAARVPPGLAAELTG
ncbi:MAG: HTH domain-containing protein [Nocardioidaceae bacterium]|nr:HTH domain-containing protein [Nocardioidaceae bacterium]